MKVLVILTLALILGLQSMHSNAKEMVDVPERQLTTEQQQKILNGCEPATAHQELNINNVRARIMNGGDMWWDLVGNPRYEVPKVTGDGTRRHSMFSGSLWIGGFDPGGNLRLAAMTYRQSGEDFWPGPLNEDANIDQERCDEWDQMWRVTREEIEAFREDPAEMTDAIENWPAHGKYEDEPDNLAPFVDVPESDPGVYRPDQGDYPEIQGDQSIWYVYNDRGNIHTESEAQAIGLEVHSEAFSFQTDDVINNATFYDHTIFNRSRDRLDSAYFGKWADPDVGNPFTDYVGSDPDRNLGFAYVGQEVDPGAQGYGRNPPAIGTIFFEGPEDEDGEEIGLENFIYYNNTFDINGNPEEAIHYYNYLNARWKDGSPMCDAGNGFRTCGQGDETSFMYPDDPRDGDGWSEVTADNPVGDRRHLQSAGPFTLEPGAVNDVTVGVVWARSGTGGNLGSLDLLYFSTDEAQTLYDNDFELIDGPRAPDLEITELSNKLVLDIQNTDDTEDYVERVAVGADDDTITYRFQGYKLYQVRDADVSQGDLDDADEARLIYEADKRDTIQEPIINRSFDAEVGDFVPELMAEPEATGFDYTIEVTRDRFADEDDRLQNFSPYHYMIVAYAVADEEADRRYIQGRFNVESTTGIPHDPKHRRGGFQVNSDYGDQPRVTKLSGIGNQGLATDLTEETIEEALSEENDYQADEPEYMENRAPFGIKVTNPLKLEPKDFEIRFDGDLVPNSNVLDSSATWEMDVIDEDGEVEETIESDTSIGAGKQQVLRDYGFSVRIDQVNAPGEAPDEFEDNGFIEASIEYEEIGEDWLTGFENQEVSGSPFFWIRSGSVGPTEANIDDEHVFEFHSAAGDSYLDPNSAYGNILNGIIGPFSLAAGGTIEDDEGTSFISHGPRPGDLISREGRTPLTNLHGVDIKFIDEKDRELWSRAPVVETGEDSEVTEGRQDKFGLRSHPSLNFDRSGDLCREPDEGAHEQVHNLGELCYEEDSEGYGWFPGYAINVETGERLNLMYGEATDITDQASRNMAWTPTNQAINPEAEGVGDPEFGVFGGKQFLYVLNSSHEDPRFGDYATTYDRGETPHSGLEDGNISSVFSAVTWVMNPRLTEGYDYLDWEDGYLPFEAKIRLRVNQRFQQDQDDNNPEYGFSFDELAPEEERGRDDDQFAEDQLEEVGIVPNPYYAASPYESNQLDNRARLINVPRQAEISIYSKDGTLVRKFNRDQMVDSEHTTHLDWNLRNHEGVPISGGVYIVHVEVEEYDKSTSFKWFAVTRPLDLDTF